MRLWYLIYSKPPISVISMKLSLRRCVQSDFEILHPRLCIVLHHLHPFYVLDFIYLALFYILIYLCVVLYYYYTCRIVRRYALSHHWNIFFYAGGSLLRVFLTCLVLFITQLTYFTYWLKVHCAHSYFIHPLSKYPNISVAHKDWDWAE